MATFDQTVSAQTTDANAAAGIGADLRSLRKMRAMTLSDLAAKIGRSVGWLSQIERGLTNPGINDLKELAVQFDVPVSFFFRNDSAPEAEQGTIVRASARSAIGSDEDGLREELLSPDLTGSFEMIRSTFAPGAARPVMPPRQTEDGGYIVSGQLELTIGERTFQLQQGDSFQFRGEPYGWRNTSDETTVVIWIIAPPIY
ncbi:MAG: XRE family transcriptional regulator [Ahrensia sp.]